MPEVATDTASHPLSGSEWARWRATGILLCRSGEVHLLTGLTPLLIGDARGWTSSFLEKLRKGAANDKENDFDGLYAAEERDAVADLEAWVEDPDAHAERIKWLFPLALRQQLLPDVRTVVTAHDADRMVNVLLTSAVSAHRLDPFAGAEADLRPPLAEDTVRRLVMRVRQSIERAMTEMNLPQLEWMLYDGHIGAQHNDRVAPILYAAPRLRAQLRYTGPLLIPIEAGSNSDFIGMATTNVAQDALIRAGML